MSRAESRFGRRSALALGGPGLVLCAVTAVVAAVAGGSAPVVGASVLAIVLGLSWRLATGTRPNLTAGVTTAKGFALQAAVVLLGAQLSLADVVHIVLRSLPVMLGTLVICLTAAFVIGRRLGIDADVRTHIGVGTAICRAPRPGRQRPGHDRAGTTTSGTASSPSATSAQS